jgi:hypothetical protein
MADAYAKAAAAAGHSARIVVTAGIPTLMYL